MMRSHNAKLFLILFFLVKFSSLQLYAQQSSVSGVVSIMNSKINTGNIQYVHLAQVTEEKGRSQPTATDSDGNFSLPLVNVREKESIKLTIRKKGLEVINIGNLDVVAGQKQKVKIFMADPRVIADNRKRYYEVGVTTAEKRLNRKIKNLRDEIVTLQQAQGEHVDRILELQNEIAELHKNFKEIEEKADKLAEKYSRVNFDEADEILQEAFKYFQEGDFEKALNSLTKNQVTKQGEEALERQKRIEEARRFLDSLDQANQIYKQKLIPSIILQAELHELFFQIDSVEYCFDLLLRMDSSNIEVLKGYAEFSMNQNRFDTAIQYYTKCKELGDTVQKCVYIYRIASILSNDQREYLAAEKVLKEGFVLLDSYGNSLEKEELLISYHHGYALTLESREIFFDAHRQYKEALTICKRLDSLDTDKYNDDLAYAYYQIGLFYINNSWYERDQKADTIIANSYTYLEKALEMYQRLAEKDESMKPMVFNSQSYLTLKKAVARGQDGPGQSVKDLLEAEEAYYQGSEHDLQRISNLKNFGEYYYRRDNQKAEAYYEKALNLTRQITHRNPERYEPLLAEELFSFSHFYFRIGDPRNRRDSLLVESALLAGKYSHMLEMREIIREVFKTIEKERIYPGYKIWQEKVDKLTSARYYITKTLPQDRTIEYYKDLIGLDQKIIALWEEAYVENPTNPFYKEEIGDWVTMLSKSHLYIKDFEKAEHLARRGMILNKKDYYPTVYLAVALLFQDRIKECEALIEDYGKQPYTVDRKVFGGMNRGWLQAFVDQIIGLDRMGISYTKIEELKPHLSENLWRRIEVGW